MAEIVKKATRESFGLALVEEGKTNPQHCCTGFRLGGIDKDRLF